jgi:hypothetical protein
MSKTKKSRCPGFSLRVSSTGRGTIVEQSLVVDRRTIRLCLSVVRLALVVATALGKYLR